MPKILKIILYGNYAESLDYVCGHAFLLGHNGVLNLEKPSVNYNVIKTFPLLSTNDSCLGIEYCKKRKSLLANHMKQFKRYI